MQTLNDLVKTCKTNNDALIKLRGLLKEGKNIKQQQINLALLNSQIANNKLLIKLQAAPSTGGYSGTDMFNDILNRTKK